ncbi:hypothetical protein F5883DRAFT_85890 [Diaporthe sp. PMI_573]|nr:hypothetical protein F5883DRAFT_85890 [Diaporthaceae sp. PMI_573]
MRQTYPSHGPTAYCCPTTFFYTTWGLFSAFPTAKSKAKQKQTRGVGSAVVGGYVVWFCPTGTIPRTEETRLRQPRAGLTNQPTSDPTEHTKELAHMQPAAHSHGASLSESRVPAQLITIVVPGRAVANAMMQSCLVRPPRSLFRPVWCLCVCVSPTHSFRGQPPTPHDNLGHALPIPEEGELGRWPDEVGDPVLGDKAAHPRKRRHLLDGRGTRL